MRPLTATRPVVLAVCLAFCASAAFAQEGQGSGEVQSMLRTASALLPGIDKAQQPSVAANIAGAQIRVGDLEGALASMQAVEDAKQRDLALNSVAWGLASQGNASLALDVIRQSPPENDSGKASAYRSVAIQLAEKGSFDQALSVAGLIGKGATYVGRSSLYVEVLLQIHAKQWAAGDTAGAENTLNLALDVADREEKNPSSREFAEFTTAAMFSNIAKELAKEGQSNAAFVMVERIYSLLAQAETAGRSEGVLSLLATTQANIGDFPSAVSTSERLPAGQERDEVTMVIAMERARLGDPLGALDETLGLPAQPWRNSSLRVIADAVAASGDYTQALSTIDKIQGAGERAYGLAELALEQAKKNDPAAALTVELAWEAAMNAQGETEPYVFGFIAVTRGILGNFGGALEVVSRLEGAERAWPLQNLTMMLVHAGKKEEAVALAESEEMPQARACALLGVANQLIEEEREAAKKRAGAATI